MISDVYDFAVISVVIKRSIRYKNCVIHTNLYERLRHGSLTHPQFCIDKINNKIRALWESKKINEQIASDVELKIQSLAVPFVF